MIELKDYPRLAQRTLKTGYDVRTHAALGLGSDFGELLLAIRNNDPVNIKEEIGDVCWYLAILVRSDSGMFSAFGGVNPTPHIDACVIDTGIQIGNIIDAVKREKVYGKDQIDVTLFIARVLITLAAIAGGYGFTLQECLDTNIRKLQKRYPDKYSDEHALNRDLAAERAELSKGVEA